MAQDAAFDLIHSLSPNEKRFFRLHAGEGKNYLHVFDALEAMKEFDNNVLKEKLKKRKLNISYEKNYLSKQILRVLRSIGSVESPLLLVNTIMADAEILYSKRLFTQAVQKIKEAKELTWKFDYFGMYMELLSIQKRILILFPDPDIEKTFSLLEKEQEEGLKQLNNLFDFVSVNSRLHAMAVARGGLLGEKDINEFEKKCKPGVMDSIEKALSPTAKMLFHSINMGKSFFANNPEAALMHNNYCIKTIEEHAALFEKNPQNYIALVSNSCIIMLNGGKYSEARSLLNKLRRIDQLFNFKLSPAIHTDIFESAMKLEIAIATESGTIENAEALIEEITDGLERHRKSLSTYDYLVITYYLAIINYLNGKVSVSQKILNEIVNRKSKELAEDYYTYSQLLLSLIHFEKKNYDLARRVLKDVELDANGFVQLIKTFVNSRKNEEFSVSERKAFCNTFKEEAATLFEKNKPLVFFPLLKWLENN